MKALCLTLVLANFSFFAWAKWHAGKDLPVSADAVADVPRLVLASEVKTNKEPSMSDDERERINAPPPATPDNTIESSESSTAPQNAVARCMSIGPFQDLSDATQAALALRAKGLEPRTRAREGDVWAGLWVYIDNVPSRTEAHRTLQVLKERGITDAYIMPSSARSLDISLGIFSESARAQRRAAQVRALGFTPTISDRTRKGTVFWLDTALKPTDGITLNDIQADTARIMRLELQTCAAPNGTG